MWQEVKNSSGGGTAQTASGTTTGTGVQTINCGFQPKYICVTSSDSFKTVYDADMSQTSAYRTGKSSGGGSSASNTSEPYVIANNTSYGLREINSTGFKYKVGLSSESMGYWFAATD